VTRLVYYCASTLDGYIAESDDTIDWLTEYDGAYAGAGAEPMAGSYERFYDGIGSLVMGSASYEFVLEHAREWPYKGKPCWVFSSRTLPIPDGEGVDVRLASGPVAEIYDEIVAAARPRDVWVVGGGNVASQFADDGLLDELRIHTVPVVLARGKPLFDRPLPGGPLQLTRAVPCDNGMVELTYEIRRTPITK
jgi:dihydrofolate reductase